MRVFSNLAISLDGLIAAEGKGKDPLGTAYDRKKMAYFRKRCDAIVIGTGTLRELGKGMKIPASKKQPANVVLTESGELPPRHPFWSDSSVIRFVFTTKKGLKAAHRNVKDRAFVFEAGNKRIDLQKVLRRLRESELENVLVEGGGKIMHAFLEADALDEINVTLTPKILGGASKASPFINGSSFWPWKKLKLLKSQKVGDELYLRYSVVRSRRKGRKNG